MSADVNYVRLVGVVEPIPEPTIHRAEPELIAGAGAHVRLTFTLSTLNDRERRDHHAIVAFGESWARTCAEYVFPGARIEVIGQNRVSHFDGDGRQITRVSVDAHELRPAGGAS
jgi:single-stranded DNA-binding protein